MYMPINKSLYTLLLKQHKVSRKDINKKKNIDKKRAIIRELIQWYDSDNLSKTQNLKLIRKHGLRIPNDIAKLPYQFAGIKKFGAKAEKENRKLITRIQKLKGTTVPKFYQAYPSQSFNDGEYVWIIQYRLSDGKKKQALIMSDKLVSRNSVNKVIGDLIRTGEFDEENFLFLNSPPMGDIDLGSITSFKVIGLMRGTS